MQAWLLARDSHSVAELFGHLKYEGCPGLWHLCLMALGRVFPSPVSMQIFHLAISTCTVYVVARFSPFSRLQTVLFAFGYYSLFEYTVVCRNYSLAVLLSVVFCSLLAKRSESFLSVSTALFLLCHTCVHGVIIASVAGCMLLCDILFYCGNIRYKNKHGVRRVVCGFTLIALGVLSSIVQMNPPANSGFAREWVTRVDANRLASTFGSVARSFVPIPIPRVNFWNSHISDMSPVGGQIQASVAGLFLVGASFLFWRNAKVLFFFLASTVGLLCFAYVKHSGGMRHEGFLFLAFVMSAWIHHHKSSSQPYSLCSRTLSKSVTLVLGFHVVGGIIAVTIDYQYPFSCGKSAAMFIQGENLQCTRIVSEPDWCASSMLGQLPDVKAMFLRGNRFGTFVIWDRARLEEVDDAHTLRDDVIVARATAISDDVLLVMNRPLDPYVVGCHEIEVVKEFVGSIVLDESFYLYRLRRGGLRIPTRLVPE
ncbi:MAG: hypothetical protein AABP62_02190 [Planctomycetota bacterium]